MSAKAKYYLYVVILAIISVFFVSRFFPAQDRYYMGADEGIYYRQAQAVAEKGLNGFPELARNYINDKNLQVSPHPLRVVYISTAAVFVSINDNISSLAWYSAICFGLLLIVTFYYVERLWGLKYAALTVVLLALAPLSLAMAKRALLDSHVMLFAALTHFSFFVFLESRTRKHLWIFIAWLTVTVLIKESGVFMLPFFVLAYIFHSRLTGQKHDLKTLAMMVCVPGVLTVLVLLIAFRDVKLIADIIIINRTTPVEYIDTFGAGPWYQYFIDLMILSPVVTLLVIMCVGNVLIAPRKNILNTLLVLLIGVTIAVYALIPKDVRFISFLDPMLRILAAAMIFDIYRSLTLKPAYKNAIAGALILACLVTDHLSFHKLFVKHDIYDPIAYNLVTANGMVPVQSAGTEKEKSPLEQMLAQVEKEPTAENYFRLGLLYLGNKQYPESIHANRKAIELKKDFADAYNNIGAAYGEMKMWEAQISACEEALKIDPGHQLARNNIAWAKSQLEAGKAH